MRLGAGGASLTGNRWHIGTGVASYIYMTLVEIVLTDPDLKQRTKYLGLYAWPMSSLLAVDITDGSNGSPRASKSQE